MAAYAAVGSLMHILDLIKDHPSPPISLDKQQLHSLTETVTFLQEFLEGYVSPFSNGDEADPLEIRIADAVHAAEDVIESYIVDNIHLAAASTKHDEDDAMEYNIQLVAVASHDEDEQIRYFNFYQGLQKVIEAMDMIKKEAMEMVGEKGGLLEAELHRNVPVDAGFRSSSTESGIEMVGFDDVLFQLLDKLTGGNLNREIIPIVGMGGIGKTTLTRNVFSHQLIKEHFDICVWATISQEYNIEQILRELLSGGRGHSSGENNVAELGEELHKYLYGRRYLVVMDDIWGIEVWDKMKFFFPDCGQGSRIIVTTRMSNLATLLSNSNNGFFMSFLNEVDSWTLFSNTVFGSEGSVDDLELELRDIGEEIVVKCRGLPLSIVVIGALLARSERTQWYWEYIEKNLSSIVNLENEEYCSRILKLSYNHLPAYLKPCFLYMGVFDEDIEIKVSTIINLWVSEGFVKPKKGKINLETVAREYFQELVDRNMVIANALEPHYGWEYKNLELGWVGRAKTCIVHDLVRDVCLREAKRERFYYVYSKDDPLISSHRRIVIPDMITGVIRKKSSPHPRSYICHDDRVRRFPDFRMLRILHRNHHGDESRYHEYRQKDVFRLVNARLLAMSVKKEQGNNVLHASISRLWSLQTLLVYSRNELEGPVEFWNMHQLKHVEFTYGRLRLQLPPPTNNDDDIVILENLRTLIGIVDLQLNEDVVRRIPNLTIFDATYEKEVIRSKHMVVLFHGIDEKTDRKYHCFSYLQRLGKLESFRCFIKEESGENLQSVCFPQSLNQIILTGHPRVEMEDVLQKIGRLPFLEELVIEDGFFGRGEWEITGGQFPRLKKIELMCCCDLKRWTVSEGSSLFPLLEELVLYLFEEVEEIPSEIGDIATLRSIFLDHCSKSAMLSAKKIVEEQEDLNGEEEVSFRVYVAVPKSKRALFESLASRNFKVL